jgi:EAL domain-containing protein (putative c-di-GMP-specific phosphodiesterase class I)
MYAAKEAGKDRVAIASDATRGRMRAFGSFYYLKHIPFDYVKIDGEFIRNLPASSTDQLILDSIVQMSNGLGKRTIAEFVGDHETVELLKQHGVDYAQGYHLGRPRPVIQALAV